MVRQRSAKPPFAGSIPAVASSIPTPNDFRFRATVESHGWYQLAPFRWSREEGVLRRNDVAISFDRGALRAEPAYDEAKLARMFQLHVDLSQFHALAARSPSHAWVATYGFGRLLCAPTLFEDIVKIILTTNVTWSQTVKMCGALVEKFGGAFPEPHEVASVTADELQRDCRFGYRAKTIHALARGIADGSIDLAKVADPSQSSEELFRSYKTLPGVGPYGAAHLLAMDGRHDFIAVDTEFRRFVRDAYHGGRRVSDPTMLRRYAKWGRWRYLAYWSELWGSVADRLQRL